MAKLPTPPGQRLVNRMSTRTKWMILLPLSLLTVSVGLFIFSEAAYSKHMGAPFRVWFLWTMYGLIIFSGGLVLLGQAIRYRSQLDYRRFVRRELKKRDRTRARQK